MRVVILGCCGMLGRDIVASAPAWARVTGYDLPDCDVADPSSMNDVIRGNHVDIVVNCAAYTAVDRSEIEPHKARAVNATAPGIIGKTAEAAGAFVVHFSTDYVFDGMATRPYREDDEPGPLGEYGRTKLAGEQALQSSGAQHLILRTAWLYGLQGKSFPLTMWQRATQGQPTQVVNDQHGRPTYTQDLAGAMWNLLDLRFRGNRSVPSLLHAANEGATTTWYGIASRIFARLDRQHLLSPCSTSEYPTASPRPTYSVLDTDALSRMVGPLPPWTDALELFLDHLSAEAA
jgi:dTDP-4-dehydrorhamnose reductase